MVQSFLCLLPLPLKDHLFLAFLEGSWAFRKILPTYVCAQLGYCLMVFIPGSAFLKYGADRVSLEDTLFFPFHSS